MWRSTRKLVMATLAILFMRGAIVGAVHAQLPAGVPIGPGVGGQVHAFAFDRNDSNVAYAGGDVCGVYKYSFAADHWVPWSSGLGFADLNMAYYVDDLVVVRERAGGAPIPDAREGVYAATWGGIYFRHDDSQPWTCLTADHQYRGGYAATAYGYVVQPTQLRIPFSCLAFDEVRGQLYAGAGCGRIGSENGRFVGEPRNRHFYPTAIDPTLVPLSQQYTVWECDLAASQAFYPLLASADRGQARQLAVARYAVGARDTTEIICASDSGIFAYPEGLDNEPSSLWPGSTKSSIEELGKSTDPWGVAVGFNGSLYALMSRPGSHLELDPGVWACDLKDTSRVDIEWIELGASPVDTLWPYSQTWSNYVHSSGDDLTELSVVVSDDNVDEVYVGNTHSNGSRGDCGYFRYGSYNNNGTVTGWAHIHRTQGASTGIPGEVWVADWRHGAIRQWQLTDEQLGWHRYYPSLRALVPFAVHPVNRSKMVGIDYHNPLATGDGGSNWRNLYCEGNAAQGWRNKGLNLLCTRSATTLADGRLLIGAGDYGVFKSVDAVNNEWYVPLHAASTSVAPPFPDACDVEAIWYSGRDEIYMIDEQVGATSPSHRIWVWPDEPSTDHWTAISDNISAPEDTLKIRDVLFVDASRMFAAVGVVSNGRGGAHFYIYEGTRTGSTSWNWQRRCDVDPGVGANVESRWVNCICMVPGTTKLLFGAKAKGGSVGGVYCVDFGTPDPSTGMWSAPEAWMAGGSGGARGYLARNVTALAVDRHGQFAYAGTSRGDGLEHGRGGVVRFTLNQTGGVVSNEILSGDENYHFPIAPTSFPAEYAGGMESWEYCTSVSDIEIDRGNPKVVYCAVNNRGYLDPALGVYRYQGGVWTHLWGGGESGSGALTVDVNENAPWRMHVGSVAQEFFAVTFEPAAHPVIAEEARYPLVAGAIDTTLVFGVHIETADTLQTATADLTGLGLAGTVYTLRDDGKGEDVDAGDGVYTSPRFQATLDAGESYAVRVFAQTPDGGYDQRDVAVEVVPSKAKFADVSSGSGDLQYLLTAQPYSAVYFQSSATDTTQVMVVTFDDNSTSPLILRRGDVPGGVPDFQNRGAEAFPSWLDAPLPAGSRGVCYADFDNDGDNDLFICNPTYGGKLYENRLDQTPSRFVNVTTPVCGADSTYLAGAITASWGDYNEDGFVDLFVATTNYFDTVKVLDGSAMGSIEYATRFFKNNAGGSLMKSLWGEPGANNICLAGCWVDLDNDGDQDLVSTRFILDEINVLQNNGFYYGCLDNALAPASWTVPDDLWGANSVSIIDYDHDTYWDLLITEPNNEYRVKILRNNYGDGQSKSFTPIVVSSGTLWNGSVVADFDLDGRDDFLLLPAAANVGAALFMAQDDPGDPDGPPTFRDLGFSLGLRDGAAGGGIAADFDGDHAPDLFVARSKADASGASNQFLYRNVGQAPASRSWLEVRPGGLGDSNGSMIGTRVTVEAGGGQRWTRVVDGGSGRGGQSASPLFFGLGSATGAVTVTVRFPSGEVDVATHTFTGPDGWIVDQDDGVFEDEMGALSMSKPLFRYELSPGTMDWIFRWKTDGIKGDLRQDGVTYKIRDGYQEGEPCLEVGPTAPVTLGWGDPGVSHVVYRIGSAWQHELRFSGQPCVTDCQWDFHVFSAAGDGATPVYSANWSRTTPITYCLPELGQ